jgi:hypothetical protein
MKTGKAAELLRLHGLSIGDALRAVGFSEVKLAMEIRLLVRRLRKLPQESKLLLETLKECGRHLETAYEREFDRDGGDGEPVSVELVHHVARPAREKKRGEIGERDRQIGFQFEKEKR